MTIVQIPLFALAFDGNFIGFRSLLFSPSNECAVVACYNTSSSHRRPVFVVTDGEHRKRLGSRSF